MDYSSRSMVDREEFMSCIREHSGRCNHVLTCSHCQEWLKKELSQAYRAYQLLREADERVRLLQSFITTLNATIADLRERLLRHEHGNVIQSIDERIEASRERIRNAPAGTYTDAELLSVEESSPSEVDSLCDNDL